MAAMLPGNVEARAGIRGDDGPSSGVRSQRSRANRAASPELRERSCSRDLILVWRASLDGAVYTGDSSRRGLLHRSEVYDTALVLVNGGQM